MSKQKFEYFIDSLCQGLANQRIKILIANGFDQWQQTSEISVADLKEMGYSTLEINLIISKINQTFKQFSQQREHPETNLLNIQPDQKSPSQSNIQACEQNQITIQLLLKGTTMKSYKPYEKFLANVTMISLEEKQITKICDINFMQSLQILHLGFNRIKKMEGFETLVNIKILKLNNNQITKIECLQKLRSLTKLILNKNKICRMEGLYQNTQLTDIDISDQDAEQPMTFQQLSMEMIGLSLQNLVVNGNRIKQISQFKHLKALTYLQIKNNNLAEVSQVADILSAMSRIKKIVMLGNPIVKAPKYRDYSVILAKTLQQLDNKKILPTEREYLVKLYSLKHAKQKKQQQEKHKIQKPKEFSGINANKIFETEDKHIQKLNSPTDFHSNVAYLNSKHVPRK